MTDRVECRDKWDIPDAVDLDKKPDFRKSEGLPLSVGIQSLYESI